MPAFVLGKKWTVRKGNMECSNSCPIFFVTDMERDDQIKLWSGTNKKRGAILQTSEADLVPKTWLVNFPGHGFEVCFLQRELLFVLSNLKCTV